LYLAYDLLKGKQSRTDEGRRMVAEEGGEGYHKWDKARGKNFQKLNEL